MNRRPRGRARRAGIIAGLAAACLGCATPRVLTARPLPVMLNPAAPSWGIGVSIEPSSAIRVRIVNGSDEPVSVLWEESAYVDIENRSHPVEPSSTRQPRSPVAPGSYVEETLRVHAEPEDASLDPLLPRPRRKLAWLLGSGARPHLGSRITGRDSSLLGKEIGLFLVLERRGERKTLLAKYVIEADHWHR
ncbi:MAG: hypothetical protein HYY15_01715 [Candidatus Omnitrophica bacterium]|nr:hypothetical protein [Candidatus Omnitrophota bacterium]